MQVIRSQKIEAEKFEVGDQINVGTYTATCQKLTDNTAVFILDQYLDDAYPMNLTDTNAGGYEDSYLRKKLKDGKIDRSFEEIGDMLVPFENGDLLRLPTVSEMFGYDDYYYEMDDAEQWELMKNRINRIAERRDTRYEWGWLRNKVKNSSAYFAIVYGNGNANYDGASGTYGVRPVFQLSN
ncbi:MAG: hypothetical protein IJ192_13795 [Clostridia bacterium]|nr:hypothetical protein [Clostridia bacterium]